MLEIIIKINNQESVFDGGDVSPYRLIEDMQFILGNSRLPVGTMVKIRNSDGEKLYVFSRYDLVHGMQYTDIANHQLFSLDRLIAELESSICLEVETLMDRIMAQ